MIRKAIRVGCIGLAATLLFAVIAFGQDRMTVDAKPYTLQVLDVDVPASGAVDWDMLDPVDTDFRVFNDGKTSHAVLVAPPAGSKVVCKATVAEIVDGKIAWKSRRWVITSTGDIPRPPVDPVNPTPLPPKPPIEIKNDFGVGLACYESLLKVTDPQRGTKAVQIRNAFNSTAEQLRELRILRDDAYDTTWTAVHKITGDTPEWRAWENAVDKAFRKENEAGGKIQTLADIEGAFRELSAAAGAVP